MTITISARPQFSLNNDAKLVTITDGNRGMTFQLRPSALTRSPSLKELCTDLRLNGAAYLLVTLNTTERSNPPSPLFEGCEHARIIRSRADLLAKTLEETFSATIH